MSTSALLDGTLPNQKLRPSKSVDVYSLCEDDAMCETMRVRMDEYVYARVTMHVYM